MNQLQSSQSRGRLPVFSSFTERRILAACARLGTAADLNQTASTRLAELIEHTGRPVESLTLFDALQLLDQVERECAA